MQYLTVAQNIWNKSIGMKLHTTAIYHHLEKHSILSIY